MRLTYKTTKLDFVEVEISAGELVGILANRPDMPKGFYLDHVEFDEETQAILVVMRSGPRAAETQEVKHE